MSSCSYKPIEPVPLNEIQDMTMAGVCGPKVDRLDFQNSPAANRRVVLQTKALNELIIGENL